MPDGLLFIPDISGFTEFVTGTEVSHSRHIIAELLERVIDANRLNLRVSEIEGDAVLFYRMGDPPSLNALLAQARDMFLSFHEHLRLIERDSVCRCGACRTASGLTLKYVALFGELDETVIAEQVKLHGPSVILAHRLLKNSVSDREYLLLAGDEAHPVPGLDADLPAWAQIHEHVEEVDAFGAVPATVVKLDPLHEQLAELPSRGVYSVDPDRTPDLRLSIDAPMLLVHGVLIDPEEKLQYVPGLRESRADAPINRVRATHTCVFEKQDVFFETLAGSAAAEELVYSELVRTPAGLQFISDFRLREEHGRTDFSLFISLPGAVDGADHGPVGVFRRLKNRLIIAVSLVASRKNFQLFKQYCERKAARGSEANVHMQ